MNNIKTYFLVVAISVFANNGIAQTKPEKVSHAEPLYLDLVRDLGARKGEKEINIGADFKNRTNYNEQVFLVEYEFAPINRLGVEVEADFSFTQKTNSVPDIPNNELESLKFSTQYSFFVSTKLQTTLAIGYTQVVDFTDFKNYSKGAILTGTVYNPFFVAAKIWGSNVHSLLFVSSLIEHDFATNTIQTNWQVNTSFHYVIPNTKHFIGVELNNEFNHGKLEMIIRPQVKIKVTPKICLGLVTGLPIKSENENYSSFLRIIYEL